MSNDYRNLRIKWKADIHILVDMLMAYKENQTKELFQKIQKAKNDLCNELQDSIPLAILDTSTPVRMEPPPVFPETPYTPRNQTLRGNPWSGYRQREPWMSPTRKRKRNGNENTPRNNRNNARRNNGNNRNNRNTRRNNRNNITSTLIWNNS